MDFGTIKPVELTAVEHKALCVELAEIHRVLAAYANGVYGEESVKRLRDDYTHGRHMIQRNPEARAKMIRLLELEPKVLAAYVRESTQLVSSFWLTHRCTHSHLDETDFLQESCLAILNAAYSYDGQTRFSTYVYHAIKNTLKDCVRRRKAPVFSATDSWGGWADSAESDNRTFLDVAVEARETPDAELMRLAIADANLTDMEKVLIEAFMKGTQITGREFRETLGDNPSTGNPWTRSRLSQIYREALGKIKFAYVAREEKVAA